jgi:hypothetical protein
VTERVPLQELVGTSLGEYAITRVLGHGSMGVVFEATHQKLGRRVALKVLPPGLGATEKAIQRFLREAQAVAQLSHDHIVPIYEIAETGTMHWYAMQFLDGESLDKVVKRGPLDPKAAAKLVLTAARAVHFAHQHGIVHRDVKPANMILQSDGKLVLTDFGLARPEQGGAITDSGAMVGTPLYMSPEQVRAHKGDVDRRTDVYSLGATLYELVTGRPPFVGESTQEILQKILDEEARPPRTFASNVPADLEVVTMKALEKERKRRYVSALELAQDLERFLEGEPILARGSSVFGRTWRRVRKQKTVAVLALVIATVVLGFSWVMKHQRDVALARDFRGALDAAHNALVDESYLNAFAKFGDALKLKPDDLDARLGRARARCFLGQEWESANEEAGRETRPDLAKDPQLQSPEWNFSSALVDARFVADAQPKNALAVFYRGFLAWRMRAKLASRDEGKAAIEDLTTADTLGVEDWETQAELAKFRFGLASDSKREADQRGELLQQALTNASNAARIADRLFDAQSLPPRLCARVHRLRAQVYDLLYALGGNATLYLECALADCQRTLDLDSRDTLAGNLLAKVSSRLADARTSEQRSAAPAVAASHAPSSSGDTAAPEVARNVLALLGAAEQSAQSEALGKLLARGGELLAAGWQSTEGLRDDFMDRFVNPGRGDLAVSRQARDEAAAQAEEARRILREGLSRGSLSPDERRQARDHLAAAVAKNGRSAQYLFELAVVEQALGELESAHAHLARATTLAASNPLFFHQLAVVCEQEQKFDEALVAARRTCELAENDADFRADRARLAIAAARRAADDAARQKLLAEARSAIDDARRLSKDHPQLAALEADYGKAVAH